MTDIIDNPTGEGATSVAVGSQDGKVLLKFPQPITWAALDPQVAPLIAERMIQAAGECGVRVVIQVPKKEITEQQRNTMITRAVIVSKNLRERGKSDAHIAAELVDIVIRGVT